MGKQHLNLFPAATSSLIFRCGRKNSGDVVGIFVQITRNLAGDRIRTATRLEFKRRNPSCWRDRGVCLRL
jgi:hypothetical protein